MANTVVLDINELYQTIPETRALEGKNFRDIRELLVQLIRAVEKSGEWEFIQYVNNKPSLFLVREVSAKKPDSYFESQKLNELNAMLKDVKKLYHEVSLKRKEHNLSSDDYQVSSSEHPYNPSYTEPVSQVHPIEANVEEPLKTESMQETEKEVENMGSTVPFVKLPWE